LAPDRLGATKLRLLREAVRHNVDGRVQPKRAPGSTPALPLWMAGCFLIASLVYLSLPGTAGSQVPGVSAEDPDTARAEGPAGSRTSTSEGLQAAPQRLARAVLPLPIRRIVLDPGHGGLQSGTRADSGASEKEITLDLALRLRRLLQNASFEVLMTRETDVTMSLEERVAFANARRADVFVSIHVNWISRREVRPVETYHVGPTDDPADLKLAGAENRESGYSLGAYRRLLEKIYIDERREESRAFAGAINAELYRALSAVNPGLANRGVKMAPFAVLVGTEMPAILVEVSCLSNEKEAQLLTTDDYRAQIAAALLRGIRSYSRDLDVVAKKEG
jgi:N-acetylmuramoyl-L-alanine amidase